MTDEFIGNYKIIKKIGEGGMARVYLAVHKDVPNLKVVLKILSDARLADRFRQEADKLALLDGHASICRIKHFFNHGDEFVIAMEFIDGSTLEEMIKKSAPISSDDSLKIISNVLATLEFAHQKDICHRDIKPGNIMVDSQGEVKIIDFGIAKSKTDPNLTITGTSCGTPSYMPPEQFNPTENINYTLVDVYSVGTTLFQMLTGELPFKAENQFALRDAKLFNDPPGPRNLNPDISKQLETIILKSLARNPEDRFGSAAEMQAEIDALRSDTEATDPSNKISPLTPPSEVSKKKSSSKKLPALAALAIIICAATAYWIFIRDAGPDLPSAPAPASPAHNSTISTALPVFTWEEPGGGGLAYILEYSADPAFGDLIERRMLSVTTYTPAESLANGEYFWRLQSVDSKGNKSTYSESKSFIIDVIPTITSTPEATLSISVHPRGDIFIDDQSLGRNKSDAVITIDTGRHVVRVVNLGSNQKELSQTVNLANGAEESLSFEFTFPVAKSKTGAAAKIDYGEVIIGSRPIDGAQVIIDGKLQDDRTNYTYRQLIGEHSVKVVLILDGKELTITRSVEFKKDTVLKEWFDFESIDN